MNATDLTGAGSALGRVEKPVQLDALARVADALDRHGIHLDRDPSALRDLIDAETAEVADKAAGTAVRVLDGNGDGLAVALAALAMAAGLRASLSMPPVPTVREHRETEAALSAAVDAFVIERTPQTPVHVLRCLDPAHAKAMGDMFNGWNKDGWQVTGDVLVFTGSVGLAMLTSDAALEEGHATDSAAAAVVAQLPAGFPLGLEAAPARDLASGHAETVARARARQLVLERRAHTEALRDRRDSAGEQ